MLHVIQCHLCLHVHTCMHRELRRVCRRRTSCWARSSTSSANRAMALPSRSDTQPKPRYHSRTHATAHQPTPRVGMPRLLTHARTCTCTHVWMPVYATAPHTHICLACELICDRSKFSKFTSSLASYCVLDCYGPSGPVANDYCILQQSVGAKALVATHCIRGWPLHGGSAWLFALAGKGKRTKGRAR